MSDPPRDRPLLAPPSWLPRLALAGALLLIGASAPAAETTADAMARALARMMEAMGLFGEGGVGSGLSGLPGSAALPGMGALAPGGRALGQMLEQAPGAMQQVLPALAGATALEGVWEDRDGGLLVVQGHRFRMQSARGGHIDGVIQQRDGRVALYDPTTDSVRPYEFAEQAGRLVLRDSAGSLYLYRRLWLDQPDPFAGVGR